MIEKFDFTEDTIMVGGHDFWSSKSVWIPPNNTHELLDPYFVVPCTGYCYDSRYGYTGYTDDLFSVGTARTYRSGM